MSFLFRRRNLNLRAWALLGIALFSAAPLADVQVQAQSTALSRPAQTPKAASWISRDALFYAELTNPPAVIERLTDPNLQNLLRSVPNYAKAIDAPQVAQIKAVADGIAASLGTTWDRGLKDLTAGGLVIAAEAGPNGQPKGAIFLTAKDADFLEKAHKTVLNLTKLDAVANGRPNPLKETTHQGTTIYSGAANQHYAILGSVLVAADNVEVIKTIIDRSQGKAKEPIQPLTEQPSWTKSRTKAVADPASQGFAIVNMKRLRELSPQALGFGNDKANPLLLFLFPNWVEAFRKADSAAATLTWSSDRAGLAIAFDGSANRFDEPFGKLRPKAGEGAGALLNPPGLIANLSLWRDLSAVWDARNELFQPEVLQGFAQLDTFAGQFFGGRDFGTGVLGALTSDWRLVVAKPSYLNQNGQEEKDAPIPDVKLPSFALVVGLDANDEEFARRLQTAFQSFIGLANIGAAQNRTPPLFQGSEQCEGETILTAKYLPEPKKAGAPAQAMGIQYNFSPAAVRVRNHFILSSNIGLTRDLVKALKSGAADRTEPASLLMKIDGKALADLLTLNRDRLVNQNMLEQGNNQAAAEAATDLLLKLPRYLGEAKFSAADEADATRFTLEFRLNPDAAKP